MTTPGIDSAETLYRQIGPGGNPIYFDPQREPPIDKALFLPSNNDRDGLSLIRSRYRHRCWAAYRIEQPGVRYRLVELKAQRLEDFAVNAGIDKLNFSPSPDALDEKYGIPWAHCIAEEINRTDYDADKAKKIRIKEWALAIAGHVQKHSVIGPFSPPHGKPYRPSGA